MTGIPGMAVPVFTVVNLGLGMTLLGGGLLLLIALWWTLRPATGSRSRDSGGPWRCVSARWQGGSSGWAGCDSDRSGSSDQVGVARS